MIYITRREHFNAAHRVFNPNWTDEKNLEVFGKCSYKNFHGHNYTLYVTVKGEINPETGYVIDLKTLSTILKEKVLEPLDHRNLNIDVKFMEGKISSSENLTIEIWNQLEKDIELLGCKLHCIKLYESENNMFEYFGN